MCPHGVLRETDSVARHSGDKFAILVTGEASLSEAPAVAEKLEMQLSVRSISVAFRC
jgi:GGDEF domain-containing protein